MLSNCVIVLSVSDIAAGKEQVPIPCINGVDDAELPRNYLYIAENTEAANINIDRSITSLKVITSTLLRTPRLPT